MIMDTPIDVSHKHEFSSTVQEFNTDPNASAVTFMDAPIIDLQLLLDVSSPLAEQEFLKLRTALRSYSSFQLVNHGVATSLIHCLGKEFFELPEEEKLRFSRAINSHEGYKRDAVFEDQPVHWNDKLHLRTHPVEQRNYKMWPDNVPNFRATVEDYSDGMKYVMEGLLKAIAKASDFEENVLLSKFGKDGDISIRFNYYPPCPCPEKMLGLRPHSDGTLFTIILLDNAVDGLQVVKDNQWYKVPAIPDALFIIACDQLEIMTNGIVKAAVHKVETNKDKSRLSIVAPCSVLPKDIGTLNKLISADRPPEYKNVKNFVDLYRQEYAKKGEIESN